MCSGITTTRRHAARGESLGSINPSAVFEGICDGAISYKHTFRLRVGVFHARRQEDVATQIVVIVLAADMLNNGAQNHEAEVGIGFLCAGLESRRMIAEQ